MLSERLASIGKVMQTSPDDQPENPLIYYQICCQLSKVLQSRGSVAAGQGAGNPYCFGIASALL